MTEIYTYDAFGTLTYIQSLNEAGVLTQTDTALSRFLYAGEQYDEVIGLYYLRARRYDTAVGRFTQEDTYLGDGRNLYVYVQNNPLKYVDPSGYFSYALVGGGELDLDDFVDEWGGGGGSLPGMSSQISSAYNGVTSAFSNVMTNVYNAYSGVQASAKLFAQTTSVSGATEFSLKIGGTIPVDVSVAGIGASTTYGTAMSSTQIISNTVDRMGISYAAMDGVTGVTTKSSGVSSGKCSSGGSGNGDKKDEEDDNDESGSKAGSGVDIPNTKPSINQGKDPFRNADFKKPDIKMVNDAANQVGIDRKEFGNYIHEIKADLGMKANQNFTYQELLELAEEYKKMTE